jgi:hypothetical protein
MNWPQLVYEYAIGGAFFFGTLVLCFRPGANDMTNSSDRNTFIYLLAGFAGYLLFCVAWILLANR